MPRIRVAAVVAATAAALGVAVVPASSASAATSQQASVRHVVTPASTTGSCFGYTGTFNEYGYTPMDWIYGPDECFGVAPSGTIWHTWSGAGAWKQVPGSGNALAVVAFAESPSAKTVEVITSAGNYYCNTDTYSVNQWSGWYSC